MRLSMIHGLAALALVTLGAACDDRPNRSINDPASNPTPQPAFNDPQPRQPNDPIANNHHPPQSPFPSSDPQPSTLAPHPSQEAAPAHDPQKPLFGPSVMPDDRTDKAAKTEKPLTDTQIVGIALAANDGEVQMAEMAKKKASNEEVKQFAAMMYTHHSAGVSKTKTLQTKTKLAADESDVSQKLKSDVNATLTTLRDKTGYDFDRTYMDAQVKAHKDVLTAMDNRLIPNAQHAELKTLLGEMRRQVSDHLGKAQDITAKLDKSSATAPQNDTTTKAKGKASIKP